MDEPTLQTFEDCVNNIKLFSTATYWRNQTGKFIDNIYYRRPTFVWVYEGFLHRINGPSTISSDGCSWYFCGEYVVAENQDEFDEFIRDKLQKML